MLANYNLDAMIPSLAFDNLLANVFKAATGSSMSISCKSWLNLLMVTPVSVVAKNDMGALFIRVRNFAGTWEKRDLLQDSFQQLPMEVFTRPWHHCDDHLPARGLIYKV
jgi:hypothetical protein